VWQEDVCCECAASSQSSVSLPHTHPVWTALTVFASQAASIHPCQHANVMHKLAERVAGEGQEFGVER
jgi:hypothetical protein